MATYNSSAGVHLIPNPSGPGLVYDRIQISAFSTSTDGGRTFTSGFFRGVGGIPFTFGDPSVAVDRRGNFFFSQLGQDEAGPAKVAAGLLEGKPMTIVAGPEEHPPIKIDISAIPKFHKPADELP